MTLGEKVKQEGRQIWGLAIYRFFVCFFFLVVAFNEFPAHRASLALGYLVFTGGIQVLASLAQLHVAAQNFVADFAERKTRHAVLLAAQLGKDADEGNFWQLVNERVEQEVGPAPTPMGSAKSFGLILWNTLARAVGDYIGIAIAWVVSSPY